MIDLDQFLPDIIDDLTGVPVMTAERYLVRAARKFCRETRIWQASITLPIIPPHQSEYTLQSSDPSAQVDGVYKLYIDGYETPIRSELELDVRSGDPTYSANGVVSHGSQNGSVHTVIQPARDKVKLVKIPDDEQESEMVIVTYQIPKLTATQLPDDLYDMHMECLASGTKYHLMKMQNQPWTNMDLAEFHRIKYEDGIQAEKTYQLRKNGNRGLRVRNVNFA